VVIPRSRKKTSYEKPKRWRRQKLEWRKEFDRECPFSKCLKTRLRADVDKNRKARLSALSGGIELE
jgi:hypothetical protein